jgi:hypothetical protein
MHSLPFAILAATPDLVSNNVRTAIRGDVVAVVLGIVLLALGPLAALIYRLRSQSKDLALLYFGIFGALYGLRLLIQTSIVPFLADPFPRAFWTYLAAALTYTIAIPGFLAFYEIVPKFRKWLRWFLISRLDSESSESSRTKLCTGHFRWALQITSSLCAVFSRL